MKIKTKMILPEKIRSLTAGETYRTDETGMSESSVYFFKEKILKVSEHTREAENEYRMMLDLHDRLPVPTVYAYEVSDGRSYLLMSKCEGRMACDEAYMQVPEVQCRMLADGLKKLWSVDITDCPSDQRLAQKLKQAEYNVLNGLVDLDNVEPDTFGEGGFRGPAELLEWLYQHMPKEEPVLSHGDYCLPNVFGNGGAVSGYIDLGRTGIADKWCDIALCYRSLSHNYSGRYHGRSYPGSDDLLLFRELGIAPDWDKIRYYILLDELF